MSDKEGKKPYFGVAGFPPAFFESEFRKNRSNIFEWLSNIGLDWIELQNTYNVKMKDEQATLYRKLAEKYRIGISLHGPYYITLASGDREVVKRSVNRIFQCFHLAEVIGSKRIIFHPGHFPGSSEEDRKNAIKQLVNVLRAIENDVPKDIHLYAETAGKKSQIGSLEEIVEICKNISFVKPCIDLAHVHAFRDGDLTTPEKIHVVLNYLETELGKSMLDDSHFHMYPVEIDKNGEKKHRAFEDRIEVSQLSLFNADIPLLYYPRPEHFINAIKRKGLAPVVVCEALDSQERGARIMKDLFYGMRCNN
jgi:deoxyribonuclease-4